MEFENLKSQITDFSAKMQNLKADHEKKQQEIRELYAPGKIPVYLHSEDTRYKEAVQAARVEAINTLNSSIKSIESAQGGITDKIDTELLTELNAISLSGMGLTAAELQNIGQRVLSSGSAICCRKLSEIAEQSGFDLHMPDPTRAKNILYEAATEMLGFFKNYNGETTYNPNAGIGSTKYQFMTSGNFLNSYEKQFEVATSSNLARIKTAYDKAKADGQDGTIEAAEKVFKNMVRATEIPEKKKSEAAEYVRAYLARMNPDDYVQPTGMPAPDPTIKSKRIPKPINRPDMSVNTDVSPGASAARLASEKAFAEAARFIDNSAAID